MTKLASIIMAALALPGFLAAQSARLMVHVPFGFEVANKTLPAGDYIVSNGPQGIVTMQNAGSRVSLATATIADYSAAPYGYRLIFSRYGDRNFLSKVWMGDSGQAIRKSRAEKERLTAKRDTPQELILAARVVEERLTH